jgi:hypothetical protein
MKTRGDGGGGGEEGRFIDPNIHNLDTRRV